MSSYISDFLSRLRGSTDASASSDVSGKGEDEWTNKGASAESVPWIRISSTSKGQPQIVCNPKAAQDVLYHVSETPLNLVSIFGAARQGKSFLMNLLAGQEGIFKISNSKDPCTQGVDLSRKIVSWAAFHRMDDPAAAAKETHKVSSASSEPLPRISFVDCEGQGDRDATYDANLICPVLLGSRVSIFNWKDSLQRDRLLNLLAVMQRAAYNVSTDDEDDDGQENQDPDAPSAKGKIFGHLHIVFRDWTYAGDVQSVYKTLFTPERVATPDATARNELRRVLEASFESISVWLLPPPVERTSELSKALSPKDLSPDFLEQVQKLRHALAQQLKTPHHFHGRVLTGSKIANLIPTVAKELNSGKTVLPRSAYHSLLEAEVSRAQLTFLAKIQQGLECVKTEAASHPMTSATLRSRLQAEVHKLQRDFDRWATHLGDAEMYATSTEAFTHHCDKAVEEVLLFNRQHFLSTHLSKAARKAKESFDEAFSRPIMARLPLSPEALAMECHRARVAAEAAVKKVVAGEPEVEEVLRDALEVVGGHAELQLSKADKVNKGKLAQVQRQESEVYTAAKELFLSTFFDHLTRLKDKGPIDEGEYVAAYESSLEGAKGQIKTTLRNGVTSEARVAELLFFLEDYSGVVRDQQSALYESFCTKDVCTATLSAMQDLVKKAAGLSVQKKSEAEVRASYQRLSKEALGQVDKHVAAASGVPHDMATACTEAIRALSEQELQSVVHRRGLETQMQEVQASLKEKEGEVQKLKAAALEKDKAAQNAKSSQALLEKKEAELQQAKASLHEKEAALREAKASLVEKDAALKKLEPRKYSSALIKCSHRHTHWQASSQKKDKALEETKALVLEKEQALEKAAAETQRLEAELQQMVTEATTEVNRLQAALQQASSSAASEASQKRKVKEEDDEEEDAEPMDTEDQNTTEAGPSGKGTKTPVTKKRRTTAPTSGGSGSKLEQARLEERKRIEEQTAKRITRGKK